MMVAAAGTLVHTDRLFAALETPMSLMSVGDTGAAVENTWPPPRGFPHRLAMCSPFRSHLNRSKGKLILKWWGPSDATLK